jgi:hypothetical protein
LDANGCADSEVRVYLGMEGETSGYCVEGNSAVVSRSRERVKIVISK